MIREFENSLKRWHEIEMSQWECRIIDVRL